MQAYGAMPSPPAAVAEEPSKEELLQLIRTLIDDGIIDERGEVLKVMPTFGGPAEEPEGDDRDGR